MLNEIEELIRKKDICVLATVSDDKPHCSLMAYATDSGCREFYMATRRETKKFRNLSGNPNVSLLIDTREENMGPDRNNASALTVSGRVEEIREQEKKMETCLLLLGKHPRMEQFLNQEDLAVLCVKAESFLLLKGTSDAHYEKL